MSVTHDRQYSHVQIYSRGGVFMRRNSCPEFSGMFATQRRTANVRGVVSEFSQGSARRMRAYFRSTVVQYSVMLTLSYPEGLRHDGARVKRDLRVFLGRVKRSTEFRTTRDASVFWFLEFQQRGQPHYHLFLNFRLPKQWVARAWYETVGSDDDRHLRAGTRIETLRGGHAGGAAYAAKYAAKADQKLIPENYVNCGRFWGITGCRVCVAADAVFETRNFKRQDVSDQWKAIEKLIAEGEYRGMAKIFRNDEDGYVAMVWNKELRQHIEARFYHLCIHSTRFDVGLHNNISWIFDDAELDGYI